MQALILGIGLGLAYGILRGGIGAWFAVAAWPIYYPLSAGLGLAPWGTGLAAAAALAVLALTALWFASPFTNLSRASQETTLQAAQQAAARYGQFDRISRLSGQQKLGVGHAPTRLPVGRGILALGWLMRQMPFPSDRLVIGEAAFAWLLATLLGWAALLVGWNGLGGYAPLAAVLLPISTASIAFCGMIDILRQADVSALLVGSVPEVSAIGVILGLLVTGLPIACVIWLPGYGAMVGLSVSASCLYLSWTVAAGNLKDK
jgi:hypothetical protein